MPLCCSEMKGKDPSRSVVIFRPSRLEFYLKLGFYFQLRRERHRMLGCDISRIVEYDRAEGKIQIHVFPLPIGLRVERFLFQAVSTEIWKFYSSVGNTEPRLVRGTECVEKRRATT